MLKELRLSLCALESAAAECLLATVLVAMRNDSAFRFQNVVPGPSAIEGLLPLGNSL
jgi:hypothetical protein